MRRPNATTTISALLLLVALLAAPAAHAAPIDVIRDCSEDGVLDRNYSQDDLTGALRQLPSDLDEYTDCRSVIRNAQLAGAHGKGDKGARKSAAGRVNAAAPPSADEEQKLSHAADAGGGKVRIGGEPLSPGARGAPLAATGLGTDLPTSMLLLLIALGVAMAAGAVFAIQRRWPHALQTAGAPFRRFFDGVRRGISRRR
jgi:hypothetical protein